MTSRPLKQEYPIDVGSGLCVGAMAKCSEDVDCMEFVFIKPIASSTMTDVIVELPNDCN